MKNVHKLTEGAVLLAAFTVLILITLYIPVLGLVSSLFLAVPFILFGAKNTRIYAIMFFVAAVLISLIAGALLALPLTFTYGLTGIVIGQLIKEKKSRIGSFITATLVFLVTIIIQYAVTVVFFGINFIKDFIRLMGESLDQSRSMLESMGQGSGGKILEQFEKSLQLLETITPSLFVLIAITGVLLIELVSFPIVRRFGVEIERWKPFRELVLPKSILWYYLLIMFASFALNPEEGTYWYNAIVNIAFLLQLLMILQGLSFIFFFCHIKGMPKAVPMIATVSLFLIPIFLSIVRILGIIDLGFELRKRFEKSE